MSGNDNRRRGHNNRNRRSKSYTEGVSQRFSDEAPRSNPAGLRTDVRTHERDHGRRSEATSHVRDVFVPIPRMPAPACGICAQPVIDLTSAFSMTTDKAVPVHFECVVKKLEEQEQLGHNERIIYIGQGKFAVAYYENPADQKRFKIVRTLQWEESQGERSDWRITLSGYYSQIK